LALDEKRITHREITKEAQMFLKTMNAITGMWSLP
jgi:hypothetical protein